MSQLPTQLLSTKGTIASIATMTGISCSERERSPECSAMVFLEQKSGRIKAQMCHG